jgi:hypothetical protein
VETAFVPTAVVTKPAGHTALKEGCAVWFLFCFVLFLHYLLVWLEIQRGREDGRECSLVVGAATPQEVSSSTRQILSTHSFQRLVSWGGVGRGEMGSEGFWHVCEIRLQGLNETEL